MQRAMAEGISVLDYEWPCPSCTYINKAGSFKCHVCGTPKGTSTRQVKFHMSALEQQYVAESFQFRQHSSKSSKSLHSSSSPLSSTASSTNSTSTSVSSAGTSDSGSSTNTASGSSTRKKSKSKVTKGLQPKWPKLPNLDRSSKQRTAVTVNGVTVIITEYNTLYPDSD